MEERSGREFSWECLEVLMKINKVINLSRCIHRVLEYQVAITNSKF